MQALGIGDGHVQERAGQQIGQGDAQQQGGDAHGAGIDHPARALDGPPHGAGQPEEHIEQGDALEEPAANGGGLRLHAEQGHQLAAEQQHDGHEQQRDHQIHHSARAPEVPGPLRLPRPLALGHHGGDGRPQIDDGQQHNGVHSIGGGDGGHGVRAEAVHKVLQGDVAPGGDAELQGGGQTEPQPLGKVLPAEQGLFQGQAQQGIAPVGIDQDEEGHGPLGQNGGRRRTRHLPAKARHEPQVQCHIGQGGHHHRVEGCPAVPHGPEQGGIEVIRRQEGHADEDDAQIVPGKGQNVLRRVEQVQQGAAGPHPKGGAQNSQGQQHHQKGGQDGPQSRPVPAAKALSGQNRQPLGEAGDGHGEKYAHCRGGPHRRQGALPHGVSHDKGVRPVIKLL